MFRKDIQIHNLYRRKKVSFLNTNIFERKTARFFRWYHKNNKLVGNINERGEFLNNKGKVVKGAGKGEIIYDVDSNTVKVWMNADRVIIVGWIKIKHQATIVVDGGGYAQR